MTKKKEETFDRALSLIHFHRFISLYFIDLRKRHLKERLVTISNKDQGHKDLHGATAPKPNSFSGASNTTLPFSLRELGLDKTSNEYRRRVLQAKVSSKTRKCRIKRNVTLHGGHLPYGPKRIRNIPNRKSKGTFLIHYFITILA